MRGTGSARWNGPRVTTRKAPPTFSTSGMPRDELFTRLLQALTSQILVPESGSREPNRLHTKTTGQPTQYWRDRNLKDHRYNPLDPSPGIQRPTSSMPS